MFSSLRLVLVSSRPVFPRMAPGQPHHQGKVCGAAIEIIFLTPTKRIFIFNSCCGDAPRATTEAFPDNVVCNIKYVSDKNIKQPSRNIFLTINLFQACRRDRLRRFRLPKNKPTSGAASPTLLPRPEVIVLNQPGQISVFIFGEHLPTSTE